MKEVKVFALGGLDELGKNMTIVEVDDKIFIIECGIKIPDASLLGVEYVICDFDYLIKNKKRIAGIFITHAHDDVMRALPYLIKQINIPIYTTKFTAIFLEDLFKSERVKKYKIIPIERNAKLKIKGITIRTFGITHSVPDAFGVAIKSSQGYIVYAGELTFDYNNNRPEYACDLNTLGDIGNKGVLCLLTDSSLADREGHTSPNHLVFNRIESMFNECDSRIIIGCYRQSIYRIMEVLDMCKKYNKKVFIHDSELRKTFKYLHDCGYYHIKKDMLVSSKEFKNSMEDIVVIVSGRGKRLYLKMMMIAMHEDKLVDLRTSDNFIMLSTPVSGCEKIAVNLENEIYKEGANIKTFKPKELLGMHPSKEDLKMILHIFKPKYYIPIKGEYRHLIANAKVADEMGYNYDDTLLLDNGQIATFENGKLKSTNDIIKLEDSLIDGNENLDVTGVVLKDREILSTDGVVIIGVTLDKVKKQIISGIDIQTRGLVYLKDAEYLLKEIEKLTIDVITSEVKNKTYDNLDCRGIIREKVSKYISKETGKRPMVLPVILEVKKGK